MEKFSIYLDCSRFGHLESSAFPFDLTILCISTPILGKDALAMENEKNRYDDIDYGWREDESTVSQQNTSRWAEFDEDPAPVKQKKQKKK